ncbi:CHAT domain-containing protein [Spirillospora sp. NPDC050679]
MRDDAFFRLHTRVMRYAEEQDPRVILDPAGLAEAGELLAQVDLATHLPLRDNELGYDPLELLGLFHTLRYSELPEDRCLDALQEAARCYLPLYRHDPELVPAMVRSVVADMAGRHDGSPHDPLGALRDDAMRGVERAVLAEDGAALGTELDKLRVYLDRTGTEDPHRPAALCALAMGLAVRGDLGAALEAARDAVRVSADGSPDRYQAIGVTASVLLDHHRRDHDDRRLAEADELLALTLRDMPADRPERLKLDVARGEVLQARHETTGDPAYLDQAVACFVRAARTPGASSFNAAYAAGRLGVAHVARFAVTGDPADLAEAARADALLSPDAPERADVVWQVVTALQTGFMETDQLAYLDTAVACLRRTLDSAPAFDLRAAFLSALSMLLVDRFNHGAEPDDLDAAVEYARQALRGTLADEAQRPLYLGSLVSALRRRAETVGDPHSLEEAIQVAERALALIADGAGSHEFAGVLHADLSAALAQRHTVHGDPADLERAVELGRRALEELPADHPARATHLSNLGDMMRTRHTALGERADLDEAITLTREAVAASRPGTVNRSWRLHNLATALRNRYELSGARGDLDAAIDCWREARASGAANALHMGLVMMGMATGLLRRHELLSRRGGPPPATARADLDEAIALTRQAIDTGVLPEVARPPALAHLGGMLMRRHDQAADLDTPDRPDTPDDLDAAVEASRAAVELAPAGSPFRSTLQLAQAQILATRFERDAVPADLDAAIALTDGLADLARPGDLRRAPYLQATADLHWRRHGLTRDEADRAAAVSAWRTAARTATAPATVRITAARSWGSAVLDAPGPPAWEEALEAFTLAVELLPLAVWHGLDRAGQEEAALQWPLLAAQAASCALAAGRPHTALELLEQGRALMWSQVLQTRGDFSDLRRDAPELAARLDGCRAELDAAVDTAGLIARELLGVPLPGSAGWGEEVERRMNAARLWADTLAEVRRLPGYEGFLRPLPYDGLRPAGDRGPVCVVNVSTIRSDAIVIDRGELRVIPLPALTVGALAARAGAFIDAIGGPDAATTLSAVLEWLWDDLVEPVLSALGLDGSGSPPPRVWWCPTSLLTLLPIHAAGYHGDRRRPEHGTAPAVAERVVSSYTPTLAALLRSRRTAAEPARPARLLAVGLSAAPPYMAGRPPLPHVPEEIEAVTRRFSGRSTVRTETRATRDAVLELLPRHTWAHLACHGRQDLDRPALGGLYLHDAPLHIGDIGALDHGGAELAYLSACDTAVGGAYLSDEAVHTAAAFHHAGYRHVVATLWSLRDRTAAEVADRFYQGLAGEDGPDADRSAFALHDAVRKLAERHPDDPLRWATFLHIGP